MANHGFINDMLDVKLLILYVTDRLLYPVEVQTLYELCLQDDKLSYFDVVEAVPQMVESGHLAETEGGFVITEKGRQAAAITKDSLAYPVCQKAARAVERYNREVRRGRFFRSRGQGVPGRGGAAGPLSPHRGPGAARRRGAGRHAASRRGGQSLHPQVQLPLRPAGGVADQGFSCPGRPALPAHHRNADGKRGP